MKLGIGVIGCGYWGKHYVRIFQELPQSQVHLASDLSDDSLQAVSKYHTTVGVTRNYREIIRSKDIDAVVVSTPATNHFEITKACLENGKHVLVEKPLATTVAESEQLVELSQKHKRTLMVGHTFMYNSGVRKVKECIDNGSTGTIYYLNATRTNLGPIRQDVNALWDLAPHDISIFNYLLGDMPYAASATGAHYLGSGREDVVFVTLMYPNDVIGHIHVSWLDPNKVRQVTVVGSCQRIVFDDLSMMDRVRIYEKGVWAEQDHDENYGEFRLKVHDGDIISPRIDTNEPLKEMSTHFIDCVQTGATPLTDGENGLDVVKVLSVIDESMRSNPTFIALDSWNGHKQGENVSGAQQRKGR
jgi:predicted dehydrogenase